MISDTIIQSITKFVPKENLFLKEPMDTHTTFRTGGEADCLVEIENAEQLSKLQNYLRQLDISFFILGNGSNLLVGDGGYAGVVLHIGRHMAAVRIEGNQVTAQAGALMSRVSKAACDNSLSGLEFASGIPGTIGGGVVMNAGAYGGELKQIVTSVQVLDREGNLLKLDNDTMEFGYRTSVIKRYPFIVTEVTMALERDGKDAVKARMEALSVKRREKQPLEYPSAGSTFKRPEGHYAGELIMNAGLAGFQIGGARVSEKHCGFVINTGNASSSDILAVIKEVRKVVKEQFNVDLEPEVVILGKF